MEPESLNPEKKIKFIISKWIEEKVKSPKAFLWLKIIAFAESSFFPIPPDPFLSVLTIAKPKKWLKYSLTTALYSVLGGLFGYLIGYAFFSFFGEAVVAFYHLDDEMFKLGEVFKNNAFLAILISAFTPIPYKIFTISAGLFKVNLLIFILASILGRGARFLLVGFLMKILGKKYGDLFFKKINQISLVVVLIAILYLIIF